MDYFRIVQISAAVMVAGYAFGLLEDYVIERLIKGPNPPMFITELKQEVYARVKQSIRLQNHRDLRDYFTSLLFFLRARLITTRQIPAPTKPDMIATAHGKDFLFTSVFAAACFRNSIL